MEDGNLASSSACITWIRIPAAIFTRPKPILTRVCSVLFTRVLVRYPQNRERLGRLCPEQSLIKRIQPSEVTTMKTLLAAIILTVGTSSVLMAQVNINPTDPQPTCNMCPGYVIPLEELEAYTSK